MVRRETREVTLRLTKNDAFPSFPIVGQPPIDFVRKFEVEFKKERDGPFPRETAEKDANIDAKAASRSRGARFSTRRPGEPPPPSRSAGSSPACATAFGRASGAGRRTT
jgi:hypothetical protein